MTFVLQNCNYFMAIWSDIVVRLYIFGVISFPSQNCNYLSKMWPEGQVHIFGPMTFDITKLYQTTSNFDQQ